MKKLALCIAALFLMNISFAQDDDFRTIFGDEE